MSTSLAINYFPHSQKQDISTVAKKKKKKMGLSVGISEFWEDFKNNNEKKAQLLSLKKLS